MKICIIVNSACVKAPRKIRFQFLQFHYSDEFLERVIENCKKLAYLNLLGE